MNAFCMKPTQVLPVNAGCASMHMLRYEAAEIWVIAMHRALNTVQKIGQPASLGPETGRPEV